MKVYVDFKDLDAEDMPSSISNKYNLQVRSINGGSDYKNIEIKSLADYTKQVRKEVCEEIKDFVSDQLIARGDLGYYDIERILDQIQGETKC